jgi:hypothetical protein
MNKIILGTNPETAPKGTGMIAIILLFMSLIPLSFAVYDEAQCVDFFKIGWENWRALAIAALMISAGFAAAFYMAGRAISDSGVVARAKDDLVQAAVTAGSLIILIALVTFLCDSTVAKVLLLGDKNLFEASGTYLEEAARVVNGDMLWLVGTTAIFNFSESFTEAGKTNAREGIAESFGFFADVTVAILTFPYLSYISILTHLQLLKILPHLALAIFLPVGIILRSLSPFRSFGGGLMGIAIVLVFFFPFLITLNAMAMRPYLKSNILSEDLVCSSNKECVTKVCGEPKDFSGTTIKTSDDFAKVVKDISPGAKGICLGKLADGEACGMESEVNGDWQCESKRCVNNKCAIASSLIEENNGPCKGDSDCAGDLWCDVSAGAGTCRKQKSVNSQTETCSRDAECGSPGYAFCDKGGSDRCLPTLIKGGQCARNEQCGSLWCGSKGTCESVKDNENQLVYLIQKPEYFHQAEMGFDFVKSIGNAVNFIALSITLGLILPLINFMLLSRAAKDISGFLGGEIDLASIYQVL